MFTIKTNTCTCTCETIEEFAAMRDALNLTVTATTDTVNADNTNKTARKTARKARKAASAPKCQQPQLTRYQESVVAGIIRQGEKQGYTLDWYCEGTWLWIYNVNGNKTWQTRSGITRIGDTSEQFANLNLSAQHYKYMKDNKLELESPTKRSKRGQFVIKGFFPEKKTNA